MDQQKIGGFLRELRKEKQLTQEQLAEVFGVSGRTVSRWETGSNMPDISILIEIAEFHNISISEIIAGERENGDMNEESKKLARSLSDYADADKERTVKYIRQLSVAGALALLVYFVLDITGYAEANLMGNRIAGYCLTLIFVITVTMPFYTTGIIQKIRWKNGLFYKLKQHVPKPVLMGIMTVLAFGLAAIIKLVLMQLFPNL